MVLNLLKKGYHLTHDMAFDTLKWNPLFPNEKNGKAIKYGHISTEHLDHPELDDQLVESLVSSGIPVEDFEIDIPEYHKYLKASNYPDSYFGGGKDETRNFTEKTLEHYVSTKFMQLDSDSLFVDMAACDSPFYQIIKKKFGLQQSFQQDLIYEKGINGNQIGGYGHELPFGENEVDAITLHCSVEHFEGNSDTLFFKAMERQLKPGGRIIILPFYIAYEYTIHVDPIYNLLRNHRVTLDDNERFTLRYSSWYQFYSRHYDTQAIQERILGPCPGLELKIYRVRNFRDVSPKCYLRFVGVLEKRKN